MKPLRFLLLLTFSLLPVAVNRPLRSTTILVNSTADATDVLPGDGICETAAGNGVCTLRAAIQEANALTGTDEITLPAGLYNLTLAGSSEDGALSGDLDVTDSLILNGSGQASTVVDGNGLDRVFHIHSAISVTLNGLTMQHGRNSVFASAGGGLLNSPNATLTLESVLLYDNFSISWGGGIHNQGVLTLTDSQVISNTADFGSGGGLYNDTGATLNVLRSYIGENSAGHSGGGLYTNFNAGPTTMSESTVAGNNSGFGGGIMGEGGSTLSILNSTISGNQANMGGGLGNDGGNIITLVNSTVTGNQASLGGGFKDVHGNGANTFRMTNSILAGNSAHNGPDCDGPLRSLGYTLVGQLTLHCFYVAATGDLVAINPQLGPLQDNGGPTLTHALLPGSPAIDAAGSAGCPPIDQRGGSRPLDGNGSGSAECDMGAYEYGADAATATPSPTATATAVATVTPTPTASATPTLTATATATASPSATATPTPSFTPTAIPPYEIIYLPAIIGQGTGSNHNTPLK